MVVILDDVEDPDQPQSFLNNLGIDWLFSDSEPDDAALNSPKQVNIILFYFRIISIKWTVTSGCNTVLGYVFVCVCTKGLC